MSKLEKYILVTFDDENKNFELDTLKEIQGFHLDTIDLVDTLKGLQIFSFHPKKKITIEKIELNNVGALTIEFNTAVDSCSIIDTVSNQKYFSNGLKKIHQFYIKDSSEKYVISINSNPSKFYDTVRVAVDNQKEKNRCYLLQKNNLSSLTSPESLTLVFNQYIKTIDTSLISLKKDSSIVKYSVKFKANELTLKPTAGEGDYQLTFFRKALLETSTLN